MISLTAATKNLGINEAIQCRSDLTRLHGQSGAQLLLGQFAVSQQHGQCAQCGVVGVGAFFTNGGQQLLCAFVAKIQFEQAASSSLIFGLRGSITVSHAKNAPNKISNTGCLTESTPKVFSR